MTSLTYLQARVSTPTDWLYLNSGVYRLHADSFAESAETWRKDEVDNPFVEGSWTVNALRENVTETLSVWVKDSSLRTTLLAAEVLRDAFRQRNYTLEATFNDLRCTYTCYVADSSVNVQREFRHAGMALVTFTIPRHPVFTQEVV